MNLVQQTGFKFLGGDAHRAIGYMRGWGLYGVVFLIIEVNELTRIDHESRKKWAEG